MKILISVIIWETYNIYVCLRLWCAPYVYNAIDLYLYCRDRGKRSWESIACTRKGLTIKAPDSCVPVFCHFYRSSTFMVPKGFFIWHMQHSYNCVLDVRCVYNIIMLIRYNYIIHIMYPWCSIILSDFGCFMAVGELNLKSFNVVYVDRY
jgi:hypothetical protein